LRTGSNCPPCYAENDYRHAGQTFRCLKAT
jgi:hypothetical protein